MIWVVQMFVYSIFLKIATIYFKVTFFDFILKWDMYGKHGENIFSVICWKGKYFNAHILKETFSIISFWNMIDKRF